MYTLPGAPMRTSIPLASIRVNDPGTSGFVEWRNKFRFHMGNGWPDMFLWVSSRGDTGYHNGKLRLGCFGIRVVGSVLRRLLFGAVLDVFPIARAGS